jgi:hypothetical protein
VRAWAVAALAASVLAAGCTDERTPEARDPARPRPRCDTPPGRGPEGFTLRRTQEVDEGDRTATRLDYRDARGRLLVYLLGLSGEVGEGLPLLAETRLPGGQPSRFLGSGRAWMLVWEEGFPCTQMAVVGNGFDRAGFVRLLVSMGLVPPREAPELLGRALTEWVAVFHTAENVSKLDDDTEALMEVAPKSLVVGPVGCHEGLDEALHVSEPDTYFSGVVEPTRRELDRAVARAVRHPLFQDGPVVTGEFEVLCLAD